MASKYIEFASDDDLIKGAIGEVTNEKDLDMRFETPLPIKGGIYDRQIFGITRRCTCGMITQGRCPQCGEIVYDEATYKRNYAYYQLHIPFIIRIKLDSLLDKFSRLGINLPKVKSTRGVPCRDALAHIWSLSFEMLNADVNSIDNQLDNLVTKMGGDNPYLAEYPITGKDGKDYILFIRELQPWTDINTVGPIGLKRLSWFSYEGKSLAFIDKHINSVLPLASPGLRPYSIRDIGGKPTKDIPEISIEYKMIIYADKYVQSANSTVNTDSTVDRATLCYLLNNIYDQHIQNADMLQSSKQATFRKNIGTRVGSSMRGNAMSYLGAKIGEVYLPRALAYHALQTQIIDKLCEDGREGYDALKMYLKMDKRALEAFDWIIDHSQVLMNRNPSIHRNNMLQFTPKLWQDDTPAIGVNPYVCFTGDTKVRMTNGDVYTFEELTSMYEQGKTENLFVYSTDELGQRHAAHFTNVGIRNYVHDLVELEFPGGQKITCTPEHPFRTKDGQWIQAKDITENTELDEIDFSKLNPLNCKTPHGTTICFIDGTYHSNNGIQNYLKQFDIDKVANFNLKFNIGIHEQLPKCKLCDQYCYVHKLKGLQEFCYEHYFNNTKQSYCYFCNQKLPIKLHKKHLMEVHGKTEYENTLKRLGYNSIDELPICEYCGKKHVKVKGNTIFKHCSNRCQLYDARAHCNDPFGMKQPEKKIKSTRFGMMSKYQKLKPDRLYFYTATPVSHADTHFKIGITKDPERRETAFSTKINRANSLIDLIPIVSSTNIQLIIDLEEQVKLKFSDRNLIITQQGLTELVLWDKYDEVIQFVRDYYENYK